MASKLLAKSLHIYRIIYIALFYTCWYIHFAEHEIHIQYAPQKGYTRVLTVTTTVVSNNTLMNSTVNGPEATRQANGLEALLTGVTSAIKCDKRNSVPQTYATPGCGHPSRSSEAVAALATYVRTRASAHIKEKLLVHAH